MYKSESLWNIHYLLDFPNNLTNFQPYWIRKLNIQLKQFDIAVTLKYGQGHWKWYEQEKLNE